METRQVSDYKERIIANYDVLVRHVRVGPVLTHLYSSHLVSNHTKERIEQLPETERASHLLDIVLRERVQVYTGFCLALHQSQQQAVVDVLEAPPGKSLY